MLNPTFHEILQLIAREAYIDQAAALRTIGEALSAGKINRREALVLESVLEEAYKAERPR